MLRVSKVDEWLHRVPARPSLRTHGDCVIIRASQRYDGGQGPGLASGVSSRPGSPGARALSLHLVMIPPGTRGMPHFHAGHESAVYTVSGETEIWHGAGLVKRTVVRAGDFLYIPAGTPHLPVNRGDVTAIAVVARTHPEEQEGSVAVQLPRHLAGLLSLPVAVQDLPGPRARFRGDAVHRHAGGGSTAAAPRGSSPPGPPDPTAVWPRFRWCSSGEPRPHPRRGVDDQHNAPPTAP